MREAEPCCTTYRRLLVVSPHVAAANLFTAPLATLSCNTRFHLSPLQKPRFRICTRVKDKYCERHAYFFCRAARIASNRFLRACQAGASQRPFDLVQQQLCTRKGEKEIRKGAQATHRDFFVCFSLLPFLLLKARHHLLPLFSHLALNPLFLRLLLLLFLRLVVPPSGAAFPILFHDGSAKLEFDGGGFDRCRGGGATCAAILSRPRTAARREVFFEFGPFRIFFSFFLRGVATLNCGGCC